MQFPVDRLTPEMVKDNWKQIGDFSVGWSFPNTSQDIIERAI